MTSADDADHRPAPTDDGSDSTTGSAGAPAVLFQAPAAGNNAPPRRRRAASAPAGPPRLTPPRAPSAPRTESAETVDVAAGSPPAPADSDQPRADDQDAPDDRRINSAQLAVAADSDVPDSREVPDSRDVAEPGEVADSAEPADSANGADVAELDVAELDVAELDVAELDDDSRGRRRRRGRRGRGRTREGGEESADDSAAPQVEPAAQTPAGSESEGDAGSRDSDDEVDSGDRDDEADGDDTADGDDSAVVVTSASRRRRRRRRRTTAADSGDETDDPDSAPLAVDDPADTVTHVRAPRSGGSGRRARSADDDDGVRGVRGSTRLEAKRQRRKDGRDTGRRRAPILTEAEFLARRESVARVMAVRQRGDRTQIGVLEDGVLVEHYVTRASSTSYVGNVYLGRVQNVLPSMEAAFVDIGKSRNGVLYAGEVNWDAAGLDGKARSIENALHPGDTVLVQVTKDPVGHKGARLTSQISLPGRYLVYIPRGGMTGISRRLPDVERNRLKTILKKVLPEDAGVIVRTAAEGASEQDLARDVERLAAQWDAIAARAQKKGTVPELVYAEPDLAIRVVRDVFNEDVESLTVQGAQAYTDISTYLQEIAPELAGRVQRYRGDTDADSDADLFHDLRIDEQLAKALDRKVWLPSGGSLVIDRTEAMTVVDVNTGKFVGSGGNLEETVTRNNLEAAEEVVRQLRLRDIGGIVVIDFIDMVLESNRDLVLRRLTECLGRDRTKHQVAEVTSLGLVQMTRKRLGEGLLEAFSEPCEHCHGRGVIVHTEPLTRADPVSNDPVSNDPGGDDELPRAAPRRRRGRGRGEPSAAVDEAETVTDEGKPLASDEQRRAAASAMAAIARTVLANGQLADADADDADDDDDELSGIDAADELVEFDAVDELADLDPSDGVDSTTAG